MIARKIALLFQPHMFRHFTRYILSPRDLVRVRTYKNRDDYYAHQKQKTNDPERQKKWLNDEWELKLNGFKDIFRRHDAFLKKGGKALCLGARTGQEVQALRDLGLDAIGIDLVAFPPLVIEGDVHNLAYDSNTFDFVFSNIFDHVLEPKQFISEIERVLKPGGHCVLHLGIGPGMDEFSVQIVKNPGPAEALFAQSDIAGSKKIENSCDPMNWEIVARKKAA